MRYLLCRDTERAQEDQAVRREIVAYLTEELVLGYRDMWRAERAFRSMKSVLRIEPVHHRAERRIVAHVHLCVLAYLLILHIYGLPRKLMARVVGKGESLIDEYLFLTEEYLHEQADMRRCLQSKGVRVPAAVVSHSG